MARGDAPLMCLEPLESRALLAGVTVITHGQTAINERPTWVDSLADAIISRTAGDAIAALIRVQRVGGSLVASSDVEPSDIRTSRTGEVVVVIDWSTLSSELIVPTPTDEVARAAFAELFRPGLITGLPGSLAALPMHVIGHSRGGSLALELAKLAATSGFWVDQVTTLDPHPRQFLVNDPSPFAADPSLGTVPANVVFADNYFRRDGTNFDFDGEYLPGAFNREFDESVLVGAHRFQHSNVRLWYHGTIDRNLLASDSDQTLTPHLRQAWFDPHEREGFEAGFAYSRLGGLSRFGTASGSFGLSSRPVDGLHLAIGGLGERAQISTASMVWPNLLELVAITDRPAAIARGAAVPIRYWYDDTDSTATITLRLDRDTNPFNNISLGTIAQVTVSATGSGFAPRDTVTWNTAATGPGTYFVYGEIADAAGRRRFLYDERALTIVASAAPGVPPPRVDLASRAGGVTLRDGRLMVGAVSDAGRAIIHWRSASGAWSAVDLWDGSPQTTVARAVRVWADAATGGAYAAVTTISGVFLYSEDLPGIWSMRPLSAELGGAAIVRGLEAFISRDGRAHLVGSGESGATFLYEQVGASADGVWTFLNLSTQVGALGLTAPVFVGDIVTLVTPWNALNIAGLDAQGQIRAFWKATGTDWSVANLSNQTGASALAGGLTAFTTSWNAMNFLGTDEGGAVLGVWWTPSTGWRRANLTASISGGAPGLDPASVTSFVTPWNAMNVVGRNAAGKVVVYWWTPSSGRWQIAPLSDLMPDAPVPVGPLAAESSRGGMSVLGPSLGGQLMRYAWGPDAGWLGQNLSSASRLA